MSALIDLQRQMAGAIRADTTPRSVRVVRPNYLPEGDPLSVYRNNHQISLRGALAATFSTIPLLIGSNAFDILAGRYVNAAPPTRPCLSEYGAGFPDYLDGESLLKELPYLADTARLDWALNIAKISAGTPALEHRHILAMTPRQIANLRTRLHPMANLVRSRYPLLDIYRLARQGNEGDPVSLDAGGCSLLVLWRSGLTVSQASADTIRAIERLNAGESLSVVFEAESPATLLECLEKHGLLGSLVDRSALLDPRDVLQ